MDKASAASDDGLLFIRSFPLPIIPLLVAAALSLPPVADGRSADPVRLAAGGCKTASSCEEAVMMWCNGYRGADRDKDGIPCENVCSSVEQVEAIRAAIGC